MAGLFNFDDPQSAMLQQMAFGLLSAGGPSSRPVSLGQALGQAGQMGQQGYDTANENVLRKAKLDELKRKMAAMQNLGSSIPEQDRALFEAAPEEYIKNMPQFQKPQLVETADPNEPLRKVLQWLRPGQTQGTIAGYGTMPEILDPRVQGAKEKIAAAGKTTVSNNITPKIEVKTGESIAGQVGPMLKESRSQAMAGLKLVDSADRILAAAKKGNLYAGPGANLLMKGAQVADVLGFGGKSNTEKIQNTRTVVRGMAEQAVAARSQLGGQAQISNSEQELLNKATSGDIAELTAGEIIQIAKLNDRLGRQLYEQHTAALENMKSDPNLTGLSKFYQVPALPGKSVSVDY